MTTLVTGAGLVGTAYARCAKARGEHVVFLDPVPGRTMFRSSLMATAIRWSSQMCATCRISWMP